MIGPDSALVPLPFEWLRCAAAMSLCLGLPGLCWGWFAREEPAGDGRTAGRLFATGWSLALGATATLFAALLLAHWGMLSLPALLAANSCFSLTGLLAARCNGAQQRWLDHLRLAWPVAPGVFLSVCATLWLPSRGEWIVGGWDPGLYMLEGLRAARTGAFHQPPDPAFALFSPRDLLDVTGARHGFLQAFPAVPLDPATRALQPYFFPLTPMLVAVADLCGGLRAATRAHLLIGLWTLAPLAALAYRFTGRRAAAVCAVILLSLHPLWVYHTHVPNSELLQVFLLCGAGLAWRGPWRTSARALGTAVFLLAATLNRFTFLVFAGPLLVVFALHDLARADRRAVAAERVLQVVALAAGAAYAFLALPLTVGRLGGVARSVLTLFCACALLAACVDGLGSAPHRAAPRRFLERGVPWLALLALGGLCATALLVPSGPWGRVPVELARLQPFMGPGWIALAAAGAVLLAADGNPAARPMRAWMIFLLAGTAITLLQPGIAPIQPWGARRYLECTLPLLALLGGYGLARFWQTPRPARRLAVAALLGATVFTQREMIRNAWAATEYDGISAPLAAVAARLAPNDILVADHHRWATPLRLLHGKAAINGDLFSRRSGPERMDGALRALAELAQRGRRVRFLTSTEQRLDVFARPVAPVTLDWESAPFPERSVVHGTRVADFQTRAGERIFRLYTWHPSSRLTPRRGRANLPAVAEGASRDRGD